MNRRTKIKAPTPVPAPARPEGQFLSGTETPVVMTEPTRVLLIGDQPLYRAGLRSLIEQRTDFRIVAESDLSNLERFLEADIDLVLIDFDLISGRDLAILEVLLESIAPRPSLILSSGLEPEPCQTALRHGISGIVMKASDGEILADAMESARRGQVWLERSVLTQMLADSSQARKAPRAEQLKIAQLTPREREIIEVTCTGLTNKQIGRKLSISEATVRHHLMSVFGKLGVSTRAELVVYGLRHNLCPTE